MKQLEFHLNSVSSGSMTVIQLILSGSIVIFITVPFNLSYCQFDKISNWEITVYGCHNMQRVNIERGSGSIHRQRRKTACLCSLMPI